MCKMLQAEIKFTQSTQLCNLFCSHRQRRMLPTAAFAGFLHHKILEIIRIPNYVKFTQPGYGDLSQLDYNPSPVKNHRRFALL